MKKYTFVIFMFLILLGCNNSDSKEDAVTDTTEKIDFYSNYEKISIHQFLALNHIEKPALSPCKILFEKQEERFHIGDSLIQLLNDSNQIVFQIPIVDIDEEINIENKYHGLIKPLGYHLIESVDFTGGGNQYLLVSMNGQSKYYFNEKPIFTSDYKSVFDIFSNIYDDMVYFKMYNLEKNKLTKVFDVSFDQWMFDGLLENCYCDTNTIVIGYYPTSMFWENRDTPSKNYLKIEIEE